MRMAVSFPTNKQAIFSRYILLIFGLLALIHLAGILVDSRLLTWSTKPLLMPMLALWFRQITRPSSQYPGMRRLVIAALLFGWVGDVCLMLTGQYSEKLFLAGLGSFLVGQLLYIRAFRLPAALRPGALQTHQWWWGLAAIYLAAFLWMLWPGIPPDFRIPVGLYGACLVGMVTAVFNWKGKIQAAVFFWALGGALFFSCQTVLSAWRNSVLQVRAECCFDSPSCLPIYWASSD